MQSSSMTMLKLGRQTQLVQLRSMATIKEKVGEVIEKAGKAFTDTGKVGKKFNPDHPDGTAGKEAQKQGKEADKQGGALKKDGAIGKQFTKEGAIGGTAQKAGEKAEGLGKKMEGEEKAKK
ncbi:hypothetical protein ABBQ32_003117 [Trebouxia sp. C0010 RCD-2024]